MSMEASDYNESRSTNSSDENGNKIPEMTTVTETNLLKIPTDKIIQLNETTDISSSQSKCDTISGTNNQDNSKEALNAANFDKPAIIDVTTKATVPEINSEICSCEMPSEQPLIKTFSNEITESNGSNKTTFDLSSCVIASNDTLIQLLPVQPFRAEAIHTPAQNIELKPTSAAPVPTAHVPISATAAENGAFQDENNDASLSCVQDLVEAKASISASNCNTQHAINAECINENQLVQQVQLQQSHLVSIPELPKIQVSPTFPAQKLPPSTTVSESLISISNENSMIANFSNEVISSETITGKPEVPRTAESGVMEKNNNKNVSLHTKVTLRLEKCVLVSKEQKQPGETAGMKSTIANEADKFENTETLSHAISVEKYKSAGEVSYKDDETNPLTTQFQTPRRPSPGVDSRTITRPSKIRAQQLPEATVTPFSKTESESTAANMIAANAVSAKETVRSANVTSTPSHALSQPPQPLGQQPVASQSQAIQQTLPPREERKSSQRVRQRTVTVQSQISLDIQSAYNEVKQMNTDDPTTEFLRRVQAIVATREKEWTAKNEKLTQLLANEQKRNGPLEQKAAERLLAMAEYEKLVQEFVEELKKKKSSEKNCLGESKSMGRPGPERNLSPDDVTQLLKERDQLAEEVNSLETSYSELFRRYEKLRQTSVEIKRNEESVKSASEEMARRYSLLAEKFEMLRRNAEEQLDLANNEIERLIKQHEADTLGLRLKVKHQESKIDSLTVSLEARQKELESMTAIFEEVITKAEANDTAGDAV